MELQSGQNIKIIIAILFLAFAPNAYASNYEISTPGNNIGIGTTSTSNPLTVNGTVQATTFQAGTGSATITGNGTNVGIGTASPLSPLSVNGGVSIGTYNNSSIAAPSNSLIVSGNIGIGSALPAGNIDVGGGTICLGHTCDSSWPSGGSVANPTGTIGLTAVNGSATSAIRSDGAPALSQAIIPTWTGTHTFNGTPSIITGGNVGIGSPTPGSALDVQGTLRVFSSGTAFTVTGANVGIGTTIPPQALYVVGAGQFTNGLYNLAGTTGAIVCLTTSGQFGHCTGSASCLTTCTCTCTAN